MLSAEFESATTPIKQVKANAWDDTATEIGWACNITCSNME
jgi:hypothetical protein